MQKSFLVVATANTKTHNKGGAETTPDKNGNLPIQLAVLAGKCPNRAIVINGSLAIGLGIGEKQTYILQINYRDTDTYGDNWNHQVLSQLSAVDFIQLPKFVKEYGQPNVVDATASVETTVSATNGEN